MSFWAVLGSAWCGVPRSQGPPSSAGMVLGAAPTAFQRSGLHGTLADIAHGTSCDPEEPESNTFTPPRSSPTQHTAYPLRYVCSCLSLPFHHSIYSYLSTIPCTIHNCSHRTVWDTSCVHRGFARAAQAFSSQQRKQADFVVAYPPFLDFNSRRSSQTKLKQFELSQVGCAGL